MIPDQKYALGVAVTSLSLLMPGIRYPFLEAVSHPLILLLCVVGVAWLASIGFALTAIVLTAIVLFMAGQTMTTSEHRLYLQKREDDMRFNPWYSVDLQVANRSLTHQASQLGHVDQPVPTLLTYPPSQATLDELNGS